MRSNDELDAQLAAVLGSSDFKATFSEAGLERGHSSVANALQQHTAMGSEARWQPIDFINSRNPAEQKAGHLIAELYKLHDSADPRAAGYFRALGEVSAEKSGAIPREPRRRWPKAAPGVEGEYWDMATGIWSTNDLNGLERGREHRLFDYSHFDYSHYVVGLLQRSADGAGLAQIKAVQGDVRHLPAPGRPLAVLRTKNAIGYAPGFEEALEKMAPHIAPGGKIVIQADPGGFENAAAAHRPLVERLMKRGWAFQTEFDGHFYYDTIVLTRPRQAGGEGASVENPWQFVSDRKIVGGPIE